MENWGLITFRETALLYDPLESSAADKQVRPLSVCSLLL
jgi:aminopeptidase N